MPVRGFVGPQYGNVGFRYGYIGVQPDPMLHAPGAVATPPVAPSTPFPSTNHPEIQATVQAPRDRIEPLVMGVETHARAEGPVAVPDGSVRAENVGAGMDASARAHSPPIWNVNSLLPGNPDVHIRTPAHPTAADDGVGEQPHAYAGNAGRGARAGGNAGRARGTGARGNAGRGRGTGASGNAGRGAGESGRGARGRGGRASTGRGTGAGRNGGSANGRRAHGVVGNGGRGTGVNATGGTGNVPVSRPRVRRRRVEVVPPTARDGSMEVSEGESDEDDEDDADDEDDSWNDDDENYLSNSLSALNEGEAEDNERVRGTRTDLEVPIADWNRLGVDDTPAAKREVCMGILYGVSEATLKKYRGWAREYKLFMAHELPKLDASRFGEEAALENANPDEIGAALEQNMGSDWKMAKGDEQWFHGPETNPWRLRKYVTFLANETVAQADRMATLKRPDKTLKKRRQCSPAMLMGRLKALNMLIKLDGAIFRKPVLNLLRDFAECRIWVRVQVRNQYKRFISEHMDRHRGTAADTYNPDEFKKMMRKTSMAAILSSFTLAKQQYTQALHRDLCIRTMTVLGHHTLARGCTIRNLQLPDMMMWKLGAKSETDPVRNAFAFVCACRTGKTNKDFSLNYISAVRHIDWTLCAVGATLLWLHWVYDLVPILYGDIAPPLDFTEPSTCTRMDAQNQVACLTEYLTRSQADNTRLGVELAATQRRVKELEGLLEDRDRRLAEKDERVNDLEAQLSRLTVSSSGPTADPSPANTSGAAAAPTNSATPTDQGTRKKPAQPTREETIRDAIMKPWVNATKPSDGWKLYKSTHALVGESPESLLAQPRGAVMRMAELIGKEGGGQNAINRVKRVMDFISRRVEQGDNIAVVLDKLDLVSQAVGMSGVSEGIAVKKKSVDLNLSELKKGSPAEVQLRVKWMLVRDRLIDASLPASEFPTAWPQYCAQMPPLA
ncbi:unnamed protein product [Closterium sp. Yama58-4]|nr:unnamed protein product [Closterium sp. Yama58-4]